MATWLWILIIVVVVLRCCWLLWSGRDVYTRAARSQA